MKLRLDKSQRQAIGARLRQIRIFNKLEQTELAKHAGVSQAIISQYEKGLTEVSLSFIKFLVDKYNASGEWIIFGEGSSPQEEGQKGIQVHLSEDVSGKKTKGAYRGVPLVDARSAASLGRVRTDQIKVWEIVQLKEIEGRSNLIALDLKAEWVKNMLRPFQAGSRTIIDRDEKEIRFDSYYAVNTNAGISSAEKGSVNAIRKLNLTKSRLWLVEDQPQEEFEYIDLNSKVRLDNIIVGRIIWVWQKLS